MVSGLKELLFGGWERRALKGLQHSASALGAEKEASPGSFESPLEAATQGGGGPWIEFITMLDVALSVKALRKQWMLFLKPHLIKCLRVLKSAGMQRGKSMRTGVDSKSC